jgi:Tat protein translocase TatB subunit
MFLLILESIGTQELILIGAIALIVFGPRKLPQMARMVGKAMAEFRRASNEFRSTWEKEAGLHEDLKIPSITSALPNLAALEETNLQTIHPESKTIPAPVVKEVTDYPKPEISNSPNTATEVESAGDKRTWI